MDDSKYQNIEIAKRVWKLYQNGIDKSAISKELGINRAEVTHIIKYTIQAFFLDDGESDAIIESLTIEKEKLNNTLHLCKYSEMDAYIDGKKTNKKLTYKRLVEIRENKITSLQKTLSEKDYKYSGFKKWYWAFFSIMIFLTFLAGGFMKGYFMKQQNYRQIDSSSVWENQEGDTLYKLIKKN